PSMLMAVVFYSSDCSAVRTKPWFLCAARRGDAQKSAFFLRRLLSPLCPWHSPPARLLLPRGMSVEPRYWAKNRKSDARCACGVLVDSAEVEDVIGRRFPFDLSQDRVVVKINPLGVEMSGGLIEQKEGHKGN